MTHYQEAVMPDFDEEIKKSVTETGLYRIAVRGRWEIWTVDENDEKQMIGFSMEKLGFDVAKELWDEFCYIKHNDINSVYDFQSKWSIQ